jgi:hypothetical protein
MAKEAVFKAIVMLINIARLANKIIYVQVAHKFQNESLNCLNTHAFA